MDFNLMSPDKEHAGKMSPTPPIQSHQTKIHTKQLQTVWSFPFEDILLVFVVVLQSLVSRYGQFGPLCSCFKSLWGDFVSFYGYLSLWFFCGCFLSLYGGFASVIILYLLTGLCCFIHFIQKLSLRGPWPPSLCPGGSFGNPTMCLGQRSCYIHKVGFDCMPLKLFSSMLICCASLSLL